MICSLNRYLVIKFYLLTLDSEVTQEMETNRERGSLCCRSALWACPLFNGKHKRHRLNRGPDPDPRTTGRTGSGPGLAYFTDHCFAKSRTGPETYTYMYHSRARRGVPCYRSDNVGLLAIVVRTSTTGSS